MRHPRHGGWLSTLALLLAIGCTSAPPPGSAIPPAAELLPADNRAFAYGQTAGDVLQNAEMGQKVRVLFGADWAPASQGGSQLALGAGAHFDGNAPLRMVRIGGVDYIAVAGCATGACNTSRAPAHGQSLSRMSS